MDTATKKNRKKKSTTTNTTSGPALLRRQTSTTTCYRANPPLESVVPGKIFVTSRIKPTETSTISQHLLLAHADRRPASAVGRLLQFLPCFKPLQWVLITVCERAALRMVGSFFLECESYQSLIWFALLTDLASGPHSYLIFSISDQGTLSNSCPGPPVA